MPIMYRAALRSTCRAALVAPPRALARTAPRRFASTKAPADRPRTWKSSVLRWGLAVGAVYLYSTSSVFADEASEPQPLIPAPSPFPESELPTVDAVIEERRKRDVPKPAREAPDSSQAAAPSPEKQPEHQQDSAPAPGSPEALEEEAGQEGAFNPETGEINWDCPCLGGMAHGPCGEEFKSAFSCFVYSAEEPKGMDCIEKFQGMQECFRKYPDIYGAELADDEQQEQDEHEGERPPAPEAAAATVAAPEAAAAKAAAPRGEEGHPQAHETEIQALRDDVAVGGSEASGLPGARSSGTSAPARWADATDANEEAKKPDAKAAGNDASPGKATK